MELHLRLLIIEDKENDAQLIFRYLQKAGFSIASERVETASEMQEALDSKSWDIIIADYSLPQFDAPSALKLLQNSGKDIPFIVISGTIGEETAVEMMKAGAHDYLMKGNLIRLGSVIKREIAEAKIRQERKHAEKSLHENEERYRIFINSTQDMAFLKDGESRYMIVNNSHALFFRKNKKDIIGKTDFELMTEDAAKMCHVSDIAALDSDTVVVNEEQIGDKFYETHKFRVPLPNGTFGVGGYIRDITENKKNQEALEKSEKTLANLISNLPGFIYRCANDPDWTMEYLSDGFLKLTGYSAEDVLNNKRLPFNQIIFPDDRKRLWETWQLSLKEHLSFEDEYRIITKNGTIRNVWERGHGIYDGDILLYLEGFITDITERKQAEEDVRRERILLRTLIDNLPDTIYVKDKEARKIVANCADMELTGYSSEADLIGKTDMEIFGNEVGIRGYTDDMSILQTGNPIINREEDFYDSKGVQRWLITSKIPLHDELGNIIGLVGMGHDITERKKTEKALIESEERFRGLYENVTIGLYRTTPDGQILLANPALVHMLGFDSFENLAQRNLNQEGFQQDYQRSGFQEIIERQGFVKGLEYAWKRNDGSTLFVRESARLIKDKNGDPLYYEGTVEDINERIRAEQLQKVLLNISSAAITTTDMQELIGIIRQQLGTLLDTTNFYVAFYDETTGMLSSPYSYDETNMTSSWPAHRSLTGYVIKQDKPMLVLKKQIEQLISTGEVDLIGSKAEVWLGVPLKAEGKVIGALVVQSYNDPNAYDEKDFEMLELVSYQISISIQRTKATQNLRAALTKAEESDRLKSAFLANMSHEIRTPMNGILGFSELLDDTSIPPDEKRCFINIIKTNGQHLLSIINDIIDISKIDSNQLKITNVNFNLNHLLDELFITYQNEIVQKGKTEIALQLDKALPDAQCQIISDNIRLRQILFNLISNSLKFTNSGFIRFGYSLSENNLQFFVSDTGKGIAKDKQSIIFERFRQEEETHTRQFGGTGLGLSISKALIELMGGKIWLNSEEGEGSTFYFTTPYTPFVAQPEPSREKSHQKNDFDFSGKTILAADDVQVNLDLISVYLKKTNASLLFANNGKETLEICKNNPAVDLVLMDIQMPVMNGYEATREIRKFNKDLPVIAFTAYVFSDDKGMCIEAGCNDFIPKPMDRNLLLKTLNKYL